jgi:hypothetical protein
MPRPKRLAAHRAANNKNSIKNGPRKVLCILRSLMCNFRTLSYPRNHRCRCRNLEISYRRLWTRRSIKGYRLAWGDIVQWLGSLAQSGDQAISNLCFFVIRCHLNPSAKLIVAISVCPRKDVHVYVKHVLSSGLAIVHTDVVSIGQERIVKSFCPFLRQSPNVCCGVCIQFMPVRYMSPWYNKHMTPGSLVSI